MTENEDASRAASLPDLCTYAEKVTAERLDRMLSHVEGVRKAEDIEPVHQMRVWSRRSRAALEIFAVCFSGRDYQKVEREVKAATDALSEARDLDVMIENLQARAAKLPVKQRAGIESFIERIHGQREKLQHGVASAVDQLESRNLSKQFQDVAAKAAAARQHAAASELNGSSNANSVIKARRRATKGKRHG